MAKIEKYGILLQDSALRRLKQAALDSQIPTQDLARDAVMARVEEIEASLGKAQPVHIGQATITCKRENLGMHERLEKMLVTCGQGARDFVAAAIENELGRE